MAVNLRLTPETASALQAEAERTGRSQHVAYRRVVPRLRLPKGTTSLDLLDRDDRF